MKFYYFYVSMSNIKREKYNSENFNSPNSFSNVTKSIYGSSSNRFLVCFQQLQEFKANSHPLSSGYVLGSSVSYSTN